MDTLGPRVMVNVGTQAVSNTGLNPRDLAPLTNDAFLATFSGKTALSANNGISRQYNNYRQSYTTQMERVTIHSKSRLAATNGDSAESDSAILTIVRGNGLDNNQHRTSKQHSQGNRNRRSSLNQQQLISGSNDMPCSPNYRPTIGVHRRLRTRCGGPQQQITVVDQMAAQPHIPYAILPKRFEPKQVSTNGVHQRPHSLNSRNNTNNRNSNNRRRLRQPIAPRWPQQQQDYHSNQWKSKDNNLWIEPMQSMMHRRVNRPPSRAFNQVFSHHGLRHHSNDYYNLYSYDSKARQGKLPLHSRRHTMYQDDNYASFDIVPSYDLNEWQGPYARSKQSYSQPQRFGLRYGHNNNGFIRDDHRMDNSAKQSRSNYKPSTPTRSGKQTNPSRSKGQQKRRNSRRRKQPNQNSKIEGAQATDANELKATSENEPTDEDKQTQGTTATTTITATVENEEKSSSVFDNESKVVDGKEQTEQK